MGDGDLLDVIGSRAGVIGLVPSLTYSMEGERGGVVAAGETTRARRGACHRDGRWRSCMLRSFSLCS